MPNLLTDSVNAQIIALRCIFEAHDPDNRHRKLIQRELEQIRSRLNRLCAVVYNSNTRPHIRQTMTSSRSSSLVNISSTTLSRWKRLLRDPEQRLLVQRVILQLAPIWRKRQGILLSRAWHVWRSLLHTQLPFNDNVSDQTENFESAHCKTRWEAGAPVDGLASPITSMLPAAYAANDDNYKYSSMVHEFPRATIDYGTPFDVTEFLEHPTNRSIYDDNVPYEDTIHHNIGDVASSDADKNIEHDDDFQQQLDKNMSFEQILGAADLDHHHHHYQVEVDSTHEVDDFEPSYTNDLDPSPNDKDVFTDNKLHHQEQLLEQQPVEHHIDKIYEIKSISAQDFLNTLASTINSHSTNSKTPATPGNNSI